MRVLLSVFDKEGLEPLARGLDELGNELVSSGGTAKQLAEWGIPHVTVESVTGFPEMPGGLVKTLHPAIHAGILAHRGDKEHDNYLAELGFAHIDMVVCNLYPFLKEPAVKNIDIGGPTMVRAAAKSFADVTVVVDPADYDMVLTELRRNQNVTKASTRRRLALKAFQHTRDFDTAVVDWLEKENV